MHSRTYCQAGRLMADRQKNFFLTVKKERKKERKKVFLFSEHSFSIIYT